MKHFPLDKNYAALLKAYDISVDELLKRAQLPLDLFVRGNPCVTAEEYYRFMKAIEDIVPDQKMPILLATADNIETITPPIFGAYCSANARECVKRIAQYKALAGAIIFGICEDEQGITVEIKGEEDIEIPEIIIGVEDVAAALGMSRRSLQRKLKEEDTTFQKQLNHVRELLAKNYIQNTQLSSEDIAYLLGYQDLNSFFRAFSLWTGKSVTAYKQECIMPFHEVPE